MNPFPSQEPESKLSIHPSGSGSIRYNASRSPSFPTCYLCQYLDQRTHTYTHRHEKENKKETSRLKTSFASNICQLLLFIHNNTMRMLHRKEEKNISLWLFALGVRRDGVGSDFGWSLMSHKMSSASAPTYPNDQFTSDRMNTHRRAEGLSPHSRHSPCMMRNYKLNDEGCGWVTGLGRYSRYRCSRNTQALHYRGRPAISHFELLWTAFRHQMLRAYRGGGWSKPNQKKRKRGERIGVDWISAKRSRPLRMALTVRNVIIKCSPCCNRSGNKQSRSMPFLRREEEEERPGNQLSLATKRL